MYSFFLLVGLLAEIMGDGRRMTYEELCNAVLPVSFFSHSTLHNALFVWNSLVCEMCHVDASDVFLLVNLYSIGKI